MFSRGNFNEDPWLMRMDCQRDDVCSIVNYGLSFNYLPPGFDADDDVEKSTNSSLQLNLPLIKRSPYARLVVYREKRNKYVIAGIVFHALSSVCTLGLIAMSLTKRARHAATTN